MGRRKDRKAGRASAPYRSTSLSRQAAGIKTAISAFGSTSTTVGDITTGTIHEVSMPGGATTIVSTSIRARATGAIIIDLNTDTASPETNPPTSNNPGEWAYTIRKTSGQNTLHVWGNSSSPAATITFWVF